ncbi:MAG: YidC/Oxa1 family membrane protein insertase [Roseburia sp.]|nr:YidC/Oxa1 family membrane protein insertase [Roseburia sp.]MCM1278781.1 YidC/Oxa1 family membrane protein insertase [Robinsoniella sp.]
MKLTEMILTKNGGILSPIYYILGLLMNGIFTILDKIGIPSIGLSIILFTLIIYLCLLPLTIKQQKFSKLSSKMNPELQAIAKKYQGKRDNDSVMKMNEETRAVYDKYGVSQTGSCLNLFIQLPIMWCLYRIIYNMPAYVPHIKDVFTDLVTKLSNMSGSAEFLQTFTNANYFSKQFKSDQFIAGSEYMMNTFIDVLNKASSAEWMSLKEKFSSLSIEITTAYNTLSEYNNFLGLNIANSPSFTIKNASGNTMLIVGAIMIPVLAALTQWVNTKLMPQPETDKGGEPDPMMASMKTMNYTMPIFSAIMCFSLPAGMGLYWISGSVIRSIQQVVINKHIDKMDIDEMVKKNMEKAEEKAKSYNKNAVASSTLTSKAHKSTKNIAFDEKEYAAPVIEKTEEISKADKKKKDGQPSGSIASKANKVKMFNEKN